MFISLSAALAGFQPGDAGKPHLVNMLILLSAIFSAAATPPLGFHLGNERHGHSLTYTSTTPHPHPATVYRLFD